MNLSVPRALVNDALIRRKRCPGRRHLQGSDVGGASQGSSIFGIQRLYTTTRWLYLNQIFSFQPFGESSVLPWKKMRNMMPVSSAVLRKSRRVALLHRDVRVQIDHISGRLH